MQLLYALVGAIVLVLLWQGVRWALDQRHRLRLKLEKVPPGPDYDIRAHAELGQVRVRARAEALRREPEVQQAEAEADLPLLVAEAQAPEVFAVAETVPAVQELPQPVAEPEAIEAPLIESLPADDSVPVLLTPTTLSAEPPEAEQQDMFADEPIAPPPSRRPEPPRVNRASALYDKPVEPVRPVTPPTEEKPHLEVEDFIAVHVVATGHPFNGEDLLRSVLAYGLRYGEMSIFHRHEQPTGQGRILFSMAKAVEPGTFNLEAMTGEEVPGVSFFLSLPGVNSIHAYDIMIDTAKRLAMELQGEILDEQQQVLTRQLIEHYRERVQEFERRRLMNRPAGH
ncbi:MAG TPA: cell division protein ZipA [Moraxellaceae bacterium]